MVALIMLYRSKFSPCPFIFARSPEWAFSILTVINLRSVLDYNPINTIASHMSYWGDEDVNHFVLSQLLSSRSKSQSK